MQVLHQQKWGTGGGHPQGVVNMAAVRLGCKSNMVGTRLVNSHPGYMSKLIKCYSCLLGGFISGREGSFGSKRVFDN